MTDGVRVGISFVLGAVMSQLGRLMLEIFIDERVRRHAKERQR